MASPSSSSSAPKGNKFDNIKTTVNKFLHQKNAFTNALGMIESTTKVKREYMFYGLVLGLCVYLVIGYGAGLIVNLLGFVYPAYKSCKAIDSVDKDDDTQWLTYWVVYAAFGILEYFTDMFLSWVPFYFLAKCGFLVWCMMPTTNNGAMFVYHRLIKPFVQKHEKSLDSAFDAATQLAKDAGKSAVSAAKGAVGKVDIVEGMSKLQELKDAADSLTSDDPSTKKDD